MPDRPARVCLQPGCGSIGEWEHGYCPTHAKQESQYRQGKRGGLATNSPQWTRFIANLRAQGNVVCQRVDGFGFRCRRNTWGFHHIIPVDMRPDLGLSWENVVGVCQACHNEVEAHPDKARFVPTLYRTPMSNEPLPVDLVAPGGRVENALDLWTLANRKEVLCQHPSVP